MIFKHSGKKMASKKENEDYVGSAQARAVRTKFGPYLAQGKLNINMSI